MLCSGPTSRIPPSEPTSRATSAEFAVHGLLKPAGVSQPGAHVAYEGDAVAAPIFPADRWTDF